MWQEVENILEIMAITLRKRSVPEGNDTGNWINADRNKGCIQSMRIEGSNYDRKMMERSAVAKKTPSMSIKAHQAAAFTAFQLMPNNPSKVNKFYRCTIRSHDSIYQSNTLAGWLL